MEIEEENKGLLREDESDFSSLASVKTLAESKNRTSFRFFLTSTPVKVANLSLCRKITFLLIISISLLCVLNCSTMFFPFFPNFAEDKKSVEPQVVGNITGILYFGVFTFCIGFGIFMKIFGPKFLYFTGYLSLGSVLFLSGFIDRMSTLWFILFSFILIILMSASLAAIFTSSYSIGMALFPNNQNTVLAIIDTISGIGYITGPIVGGLLYDNLGWFWAYAINAIIIFIAFAVSIFLLPAIKIEKVESESIKDYINILRLLPNLNVLSVILVNLVVTIGWSYQYTSLGPYLERTYNSSSETIGYVFSIPNLSYTIMLPIIGILSEKTVSRVFILLSLPLLILSLILIPPIQYIFTDRFRVTRPSVDSHLFPLPHAVANTNYLAVTIIGQVLLGIAYTLAYGPMYVDMKRNVPEKTREKLVNLPEVLSSIRIATYFLASGVGPIISGFIEPNLSFDDETLIFIFVASIAFLLFTPLSIGNFILNFFKRKKVTFDMF